MTVGPSLAPPMKLVLLSSVRRALGVLRQIRFSRSRRATGIGQRHNRAADVWCSVQGSGLTVIRAHGSFLGLEDSTP